MGEVRRVAIQQLADAQIRGEIGKGYAARNCLSVVAYLDPFFTLLSWLAHLTLDEGDRIVIRLSAPLA